MDGAAAGVSGAGAAEAAPATSFDEATWRARLLELNPWAAGLKIDEWDEAFVAARKAACLTRWEAQDGLWNTWATAMMALRHEAEAAKLWQAQKNGAHLTLAQADFRAHTFPGDASFGSHVFPGNARFDKAIFGDKEKSPGGARFEGAQFSGGGALFEGAQFSGGAALFEGAQFSGGAALFGGAQFSGGDALFGGAQFSKRTYFNKVQFSFDEKVYKTGQRAEFHHGAIFNQATFEQPADFSDAIFHKAASFDQAQLKGSIDLRRAEFRDEAIFTSVQSKVAFSLAGATFAKVPDFVEATFHEPPRLDNVTLPATSLALTHAWTDDIADPRPPAYRRRHRVAANGDIHARLRKLRAIASQARDSESELKFNADENRARRFWVDKPWPLRAGAVRFWGGLAFDKLSGFGMSIARPLTVWAVLLVAFAYLYVSPLSGRAPGEPMPQPWFISAQVNPPWTPIWWLLDRAVPTATCHPSFAEETTDPDRKDDTGKVHVGHGLMQPTNALTEAAVLSFRNALIFNRSDVARRMYGCLYGIQSKGGQDYATIPPLVSLLSALQSFASAVLIFLTGLGIRNMFRIK